MQYIVDFAKSLGEIITSIIEFIIDLFTGFVDFFTSIPDYIETIEDLIELLPDFAIPFVVMVLAAQLIFLIIQRRGQ